MSSRDANIQGRSIAITPEMLNPFSVGIYDIARKGYLLPVALLLLLFTVGPSEFEIGTACTLLSVGVYCYFYSLCGKRKPWWVALGVGAVMAFLVSPFGQPLLWSPYFSLWHHIYPQEPDLSTTRLGFFELAFMNFFGVGLREEIFKSLAVFLAFFVAKNAADKYGRYIRITEPLDGILLAIASGLGFAISETVFLYAAMAQQRLSGQLQQHNLPADLANEIGHLYAFYLTFRRSVLGIAGHAAYSGYLGYFIGMGAMKPRQRWRFFAIGLLWAAALHACWDASQSEQLSAVIAVISYAGLIAAVLQARRISPGREENFATQAYSPSRMRGSAPVPMPIPQPPAGWELRAVSGTLAGRSYPVDSRLLLGRDPSRCDVVLDHGEESVSRRHCELTVDGEGLLLADCGSSNGTFLASGDRLAAGDSRRLYEGDRFYVGSRAITFEVMKRSWR